MRSLAGPLALTMAILATAPASADGGTGGITGQVTAKEAPGPIVVFLAEVPTSAKERAARRPAGRLRVELRDRQFSPPQLIVRQGQWVEFWNRDSGYHSVYSLSPGNEFDLGLGEPGAPRAVELRAPGEVEVFCDLHPEMAARILVLQNDYQTQVAQGGGYSLLDVPAGSYTLVAWSPSHRTERRRVRVRDGAIAHADFALRLRQSPEAHLGRRGGVY